MEKSEFARLRSLPGTQQFLDLLSGAGYNEEGENQRSIKLVLSARESVELPAELATFLFAMVQAVQNGGEVTVTMSRDLISTQEAAEILGVSRPTVVRLLESGKIPFEKIGSHRRINKGDVLSYREARRRAEYQAFTLSVMDEDEEEDFEQVLLELREVRRHLAEVRRRSSNV
jgi:excisionase family DNA binding protein